MVTINKEMLESMVKRTGLRLSSCLDLLAAGWTYVEEINKPARWEAPSASLRRN